jgi:hypothetical protein
MSLTTRTTCFALLIAALTAIGQQQLVRGAGSPMGSGVHPRVLLSPDELVPLRAKLAGPLKPDYQEFVAFLDANYGAAGTDSEFYYFMRDYAFVYAIGNVSGVSYGRSMNEYGAKALELLRKISAAHQTGDAAVQTMAVTYDWVFPLLTAADRVAVVDALKIAAFKPGGPGGGRSAFHHREIKDRMNYLLAGLAFANDGVDNAEASARVAAYATYVTGDGGVLPARNFIAGGEGGVSVGQEYAVNGTGGDGLVMTELQLTEAWRTANGLSSPATYAADNALRFYPQWMTYALTPYKNAGGDTFLYSGHFMDRGTLARGFAEFSTILASARVYQSVDPSMASLAQWLMDGPAGPVANSGITGKRKAVLANFIFNPGGVTPKSPEMLGLPLSKWFRGTGWLSMRTGWSSIADTLVTFTASPFTRSPAYANSNHGSFTIDRGGPLAIHAGRGVHHAFSDSTRAYNTITFPDPNEPVGTWPEYWDMGGQRSFFKVPAGLSEYVKGSQWDIGGVKTADVFDGSASHDYDYVASNLTRAYNGPANNEQYNTSKVKLFTRQFVYFRRETSTGPDRVIVFDRTETTGTQFDKRWMFHPAGRDDGTRSFVISGHSSLTAGPSRNGSTEGKRTFVQPDLITVTNNIAPNNGRLFWKPLLPANRIIVEVGGPNSAGTYSNATSHEYETAHGKQDIESGNYGNSLAQWVGQYSLELQPANRNLYDVFLNVLEATTTAQSAMSSTTVLNGPKTVGALVGSRIAVFNRTEGFIANDSLVVPTSGSFRVLFCDLQPGMVYTINGATLTASSSGTAYATVTVSAGSSLNIAATGSVVSVPPSAPSGLRIVGG